MIILQKSALKLDEKNKLLYCQLKLVDPFQLTLSQKPSVIPVEEICQQSTGSSQLY